MQTQINWTSMFVEFSQTFYHLLTIFQQNKFSWKNINVKVIKRLRLPMTRQMKETG